MIDTVDPMSTLLRHDHRPPVPTSTRRSGRWRLIVVLAVLAAAVAGTAAVVGTRVRDADLRRDYLGADGWPSAGQAAYRSGGSVHVGPHQHPASIASLAKVMTAYLVLRAHPLPRSGDGPTLRLGTGDVRDYERRRAGGESVVRVAAGERLTERQALLALLLPSANNIAVVLARWTAGTVSEFVARMNATARLLGMASTRYTDPSGLDPGTVSTAADQLRLAGRLAGDDALGTAFGLLVAQTSAVLPVAGLVHNTDTLLGQDGFVGTKTGSDDAAGGCFMFRTWRVVRGTVTDVVGVVLGQHGRHAVTAGLYAARQLADRLGPAAGA